MDFNYSDERETSTMIYKQYGKTGKKVSAVGFGGMRFDTDQPQEKNAELVLHAFDKGINYFDTAPDYCYDQSEDIFGSALKQLRKERDRFFISTKGMPTALPTAAQARGAVEKSLKRLKVDKIDFYHVWCIRTLEHYELAMKKGGQYEALRQCQEEGMIEHIVVSTHLDAEGVGQVLSRGDFDGVLLGVNILNFPYRWDGVQKAYEAGIGVVAMNPLAGGAIAQYADELTYLTEGNETPVEAALRFCISCPQITVTLNGFATQDHIDTACRVADNCQPFQPEDIERIRKRVARGMDKLCTGCGYCLESCVQNIPIASYLQYYNAKSMFGRTDEEMMTGLKEQYEWQLLVGRKAEAGDCIECGKCEEACTQHLPIMERLREMAEWQKEMERNKISDNS